MTNDEFNKQAKKPAVQHVKERGAFRSLLLSNPNYFGNVVESPLKPTLPLAGSTVYEELGCVGHHPQQQRVEAVVYINQSSGYGTDICGPGTPEFVRFYLSFDNGATWHDQGMTSFQAYNIPEGTEGEKRLEYAVSLPIGPRKKFCFFDPLVRVRAILSWNNPPPANQPNWTPIWGNVRHATILLEPRRLIFPLELLEVAKVQLTPEIKDLIDLDAPVATKKKTLGAAELATLYRGKDVPVHRFAFKELAGFTTASVTLSAESWLKTLPGLEISPDIFDLLFPKTDGDISYEELKCVGLDPNMPDTLVGVIQVKKALGYSGGPCTDGSKEYVTFWGDFDGNGTFETCLGTANVSVYDVVVPPEGVHYAVRLPVDLTQYRRPCKEGPRLVRIRAILSWNAPAPCANPNHVPAWGNREETLINIAPTSGLPAGKITILGGIPVGHIDNATGLTDATAVFATNNIAPDSLNRPCPFGGRVTAQGLPIPGYSYIVEVSPDNSIWTPLLTDLIVTDEDGNTSPHKADNVTKRFDYLPFTKNAAILLGHWDSAGDALWYVRLSVYDSGGMLQGTDTHRIQLDNTWPEASIEITTGSGNCGKFDAGTALAGNFVARDLYLSQYSVAVEPAINDPGVGVPVPSSGLVNTAPAPGNGWTLDTTNMKPCGYIIRVVASDRAIWDSQWVGHHSPASAGFCIEKKGKP